MRTSPRKGSGNDQNQRQNAGNRGGFTSVWEGKKTRVSTALPTKIVVTATGANDVSWGRNVSSIGRGNPKEGSRRPDSPFKGGQPRNNAKIGGGRRSCQVTTTSVLAKERDHPGRNFLVWQELRVNGGRFGKSDAQGQK